jgi:hypothetical protein
VLSSLCGTTRQARSDDYRDAKSHGTIKAATDDGIVVLGRDTGNTDREWAFVVDAGTQVAGGQARAARDLRQGDHVTVTYTNRDGKVVAQSVTVSPR